MLAEAVGGHDPPRALVSPVVRRPQPSRVDINSSISA
jgi:hypothetical protein